MKQIFSLTLCGFLLSLNSHALTHTGPDTIEHFAYVARDRSGIHHQAFLKSKKFKGAQIMYLWRNLEPQKGKYNFVKIRQDVQFLKKHNKKLFLQLQDATFNPKVIPLPQYMINNPDYKGAVSPQYNDKGIIQGWVSNRWDKEVQRRLKGLICALANEFDGQLAGINLQETSIEVTYKGIPNPIGFTPVKYRDGILNNMSALKTCFKKSRVMQYANFMPGEWLPHENRGYLESVYTFGKKNGIAMGAPDLMPQRKGQRNHAYKQMNKGNNTFGIAVQDGNYFGKTGNPKIPETTKSKIPILYDYAKKHLKVQYMFWVIQEPFFSRDLIPFIEKKP